MRAIVYTAYGPPDVLELTEVETPTPRDNEVLIRIRAAAVTTTDCNLRSGDKLMRLVFGLRKPRRPILGTEFAGEIQATGKAVERFRDGDQGFAATGAGLGRTPSTSVSPNGSPRPTGASKPGTRREASS
jgi:NADPH:quinone reductase-like Zn-dependent oxidoreductase